MTTNKIERKNYWSVQVPLFSYCSVATPVHSIPILRPLRCLKDPYVQYLYPFFLFVDDLYIPANGKEKTLYDRILADAADQEQRKLWFELPYKNFMQTATTFLRSASSVHSLLGFYFGGKFKVFERYLPIGGWDSEEHAKHAPGYGHTLCSIRAPLETCFRDERPFWILPVT